MRRVIFKIGLGSVGPKDSQAMSIAAYHYLRDNFAFFTAESKVGAIERMFQPIIIIEVETEISDTSIENCAKRLRDIFDRPSVLFSIGSDRTEKWDTI